MRSIAKPFYNYENIRINALCPGVVKTNLLTTKDLGYSPEEFFTPVGEIAETVARLINGEGGIPRTED